MSMTEQRDLIGYGQHPPHPKWPDDARIALNFVINYEEGAERTPLLGDSHSETYGGEFPLSPKPEGMRNLSMESLFEYGSRAGIWRLFRLFEQHQMPVTVFATGLALKLNPAVGEYCAKHGHEIAGHGWRWIDYANMPVDEERQHIQQTVDIIRATTGSPPVGWYTGRRSANTRPLLLEVGGFLYDSESYADDLPYTITMNNKDHLIIPYTLDCNDFRYTTTPGFSHSNDFFTHLKDSFDFLYDEAKISPKMMTVGLHPRISGRPARAAALNRFLDYAQSFEKVWICRRDEIARHWLHLSN